MNKAQLRTALRTTQYALNHALLVNRQLLATHAREARRSRVIYDNLFKLYMAASAKLEAIGEAVRRG